MTHMKAIQCIAKFQLRGFHNLTLFIIYIHVYQYCIMNDHMSIFNKKKKIITSEYLFHYDIVAP